MCVFVHVHAHTKTHICAKAHHVGPGDQPRVPSVGSSSLPHLAVFLALHTPFPVLNLLGKLRLKELCVLPKLEQLSEWLWSHVHATTTTPTSVSYSKYECTSELSEKYSKYLALPFISRIQWKRPLTHETINVDCRLLEIPCYSVSGKPVLDHRLAVRM